MQYSCAPGEVRNSVSFESRISYEESSSHECEKVFQSQINRIEFTAQIQLNG